MLDSDGADETLALLLPLLLLLTVLLLLLLLFLLFLLLKRRQRPIRLPLTDGPVSLSTDLSADPSLLTHLETTYLATVSPEIRSGYALAKDWQIQYSPNSFNTDITLNQFLTIQEKGVSAWSFEPDYEANPSLSVCSRTEITFLADGMGMTAAEGGGCSVMSNLPLPRLNEVVYWECKMYELPVDTVVAVGLATKPYPAFRLPGWNKYSIGYFSSDGFKSHSYPFTSTSYGPPLKVGDVLGVGYRPRTGIVFFTRNGKKLPDAFVGFNQYNLFPIIGADGAAEVHVNFGQAGFVFIEANVKKWGLGPMLGTLAPPPAYGCERGSILLEAAGRSGDAEPGASTGSRRRGTIGDGARPPASTQNAIAAVEALASSSTMNAAGSRPLSSTLRRPNSQSIPIVPSPLRHSRSTSSSLQPIAISNRRSGSNSTASTPVSTVVDTTPIAVEDVESGDEEDERGRNPPTPGAMDISLRSLHAFPDRAREDAEDEEEERRAAEEAARAEEDSEGESEAEATTLLPTPATPLAVVRTAVLPPAYNPIDPHMCMSASTTIHTYRTDAPLDAPGVAEAVLEDAFSGVASRQFLPSLSALSSPLAPSTNAATRPSGSASGSNYASHSSSSLLAAAGGGLLRAFRTPSLPVASTSMPSSSTVAAAEAAAAQARYLTSIDSSALINAGRASEGQSGEGWWEWLRGSSGGAIRLPSTTTTSGGGGSMV